ncbi:hypothetical protein [Helicobacter kayseriensis]|uniref:hypothetical protein n=1 Tax=Helicobacter kayseriensis TaxID=2905877 RepID=UPI001E406D4E|nr:hypothetical protein [Helicobacter kayseriensis]MCE3047519.1 hypothetical protein [Helicobacter kayseriensis]MCE3048841.1 hypothetical protein [Helicobacter kayseriensis]
MKKNLIALIFGLFCMLHAQEEEMTQAQKIWGRKFQAGLGYAYFNTGHHGLQINYGMWDLNTMGIQAEIFVPLTYSNESKIYLVTFYWVAWDWAPIKELSIIPKVGYGPKIYERKDSGFFLSWEPSLSLDLSYNINAFVKLYASYTWAMFKDEQTHLNQLHGGSVGVRIAY